MRKENEVNYRGLFKKHYDIEFSRELEVHHLDFDRSNNSIENLLLLPRTIHRDYHQIEAVFKMFDDGNNIPLNCLRRIAESLPLYADISKLGETILAMHEWIKVKEDQDIELEKAKRNEREPFNIYRIFIRDYITKQGKLDDGKCKK